MNSNYYDNFKELNKTILETCGAGTTTFPNQVIPNVVGSLVPCGELRLVDWEEGGYRNTDPNPRGEIYLGGENITMV